MLDIRWLSFQYVALFLCFYWLLLLQLRALSTVWRVALSFAAILIFADTANVTYLNSFGSSDLRIKFAVFNLLNQQRTVRVDQELQPSVGMDEDNPTRPQFNEFFGEGYGFQPPRYAQLTVSVTF